MPSKPDSDGLGRAWVGKLFRPKFTFSAGVPHKAAVKLSLPIGMLYAELLLETTVRIQGNILCTNYTSYFEKLEPGMYHKSSAIIPETWQWELSLLKRRADN